MKSATELIIDSSKAVAGASDYACAMDRAEAAMQRSLDAMSAIADVPAGTIKKD